MIRLIWLVVWMVMVRDSQCKSQCKSLTPCFVEDAKSFARVFTQLMEKARAIVGYHSHSAKRATELKQSQIALGIRSDRHTLKLLRDVPTRWNSRYDLLHRLIELDVALRTYLPNELRLSNNELVIISDVRSCDALH